MTVVLFPNGRRSGHARKLAAAIAGARSKDEAAKVLAQAVAEFDAPLLAAGALPADLQNEWQRYVLVVRHYCAVFEAEWVPAVAGSQQFNNGSSA